MPLVQAALHAEPVRSFINVPNNRSLEPLSVRESCATMTHHRAAPAVDRCLVVAGTSSLFLDAIAIALEQRQVGQPWYTSTGNLQLVSLGVCTVCRDMAMLHVRVERRTPRSLWVVTSRSSSPQSSLKTAVGKVVNFASRQVANGRRPMRVPQCTPRGATWR